MGPARPARPRRGPPRHPCGARPRAGRPAGWERWARARGPLLTRAVWWTIARRQRAGLAAAGVARAGAAHAAEHASIALLPLVASCDRWDIGGVSFELNPATGRLTV